MFAVVYRVVFRDSAIGWGPFSTALVVLRDVHVIRRPFNGTMVLNQHAAVLQHGYICGLHKFAIGKPRVTEK